MASPDDRLTRLRALIARLERLPASAESEWMLREARARMVDVETGERPSGMRPLSADPPVEAPPRRREVAAKRPAEPRPEHRAEPAQRPPSVVPERSADPSVAAPGIDELLWLEDSPREEDAAPAQDEGDVESQPWRRGLRG